MDDTNAATINASTAGQLKAFIERVERLEEEKRTIADDIKDVYAEAKANGFDAKILRKIVSLRRQDADERREQERNPGNISACARHALIAAQGKLMSAATWSRRRLHAGSLRRKPAE